MSAKESLESRSGLRLVSHGGQLNDPQDEQILSSNIWLAVGGPNVVTISGQ